MASCGGPLSLPMNLNLEGVLMASLRLVAARLVLVSVALLTFAAGSRLAAQEGVRVPVYIAAPDSFPDPDAVAVVVRTPEKSIVLVDPARVTAETLAVALTVLARRDERDPHPIRGEAVPITGFVFTRQIAASERERLDALLERLAARPVSRVGTLGRGRWIPYSVR